MWANAQRDGRPAEYRWRPLFNAAKFGWRPLLECRAVTLPRRWNLQGCPKLVNRSQPLVGGSSPYCEDTWRRYWCLTSVFSIVVTCLSCKDITRQSCAMVSRWRFLATFLCPVFSASRMQQVSDLHRKFALRPHHVWKNWSLFVIFKELPEAECDEDEDEQDGDAAVELQPSPGKCLQFVASAFSALTLLVRWHEGHPAYKNWVVWYWLCYLSGARCKWFAYGFADATATPSSLAPVKSKMVYLSGAGLPRLSWKKGREMDVVVLVVLVTSFYAVIFTYVCRLVKTRQVNLIADTC